MSKDGSIIVNSSQSNQVIALLIHNGYFIEEVRRYTKMALIKYQLKLY